MSDNDVMQCPNDRQQMNEVAVRSHYATELLIEQCPTCGGIWFDKTELHRAKHGESKKVESINTDTLRSSSPISKETLLCPKDGAKIFRFTDKYFPIEIIVERCPTCDGFWLNRGEFSEYQSVRHGLRANPTDSDKEKDAELSEQVRRMLELHHNSGATDTLARLGTFLSTPIDRSTLRPVKSHKQTPDEERALLGIMQIIIEVLKLVIR